MALDIVATALSKVDDEGEVLNSKAGCNGRLYEEYFLESLAIKDLQRLGQCVVAFR